MYNYNYLQHLLWFINRLLDKRTFILLYDIKWKACSYEDTKKSHSTITPTFGNQDRNLRQTQITFNAGPIQPSIFSLKPGQEGARAPVWMNRLILIGWAAACKVPVHVKMSSQGYKQSPHHRANCVKYDRGEMVPICSDSNRHQEQIKWTEIWRKKQTRTKFWILHVWLNCRQHIHHVYDLHISVIFGLHFCLQTAKRWNTGETFRLADSHSTFADFCSSALMFTGEPLQLAVTVRSHSQWDTTENRGIWPIMVSWMGLFTVDPFSPSALRFICILVFGKRQRRRYQHVCFNMSPSSHVEPYYSVETNPCVALVDTILTMSES